MKWKRVIIPLLFVVTLAGAFWTGHYAGAASKTPGSAEDPLVTLSYLETRISEGNNGYEKVRLSKGEQLAGDEGTSIIVLGGSLIASEGNLIDVTEGRLTEVDTSLFLYHNYMVPETKNGCEALSSCVLLVSGGYEIK